MTQEKVNRINEITHLQRRVRGYLVKGVLDTSPEFLYDPATMTWVSQRTGETVTVERLEILNRERDQLLTSES